MHSTSAPNPSIERTCPGKPGHAAHVERWASLESHMKAYQLVIQFPQDFFTSFDAMVGFEEKLIASMPKTCDVDGHDVGSGTINFFIYTNYPGAAHRAFRRYLSTNAVERKLRIAYRSVEGDEFTNMWPRRDPRPFKYMYDEDENPFARGAKRVIPKRSKAIVRSSRS
ncbi:hypothetical protein OB934_22870 [Aeromonas salmonicida]|uniref:hypothetical protein n=1 Tax=Aeromonas salmonicida TaxID=645 RepID=UPI00259D673D|nr:hypothetical protein [Aeromonas salmonicida]MDM5065599.1 hypothetical protein [Aeromonas salmonicida]